MQDTATAWLVPLSGPPLEPIQITAAPCGVTLGRSDACALKMPATADKVSRQHLRFTHAPAGPAIEAGAGWRVADLGSRWGTSLNGVRLAAHREVPLGEGDLLRVEPWTFSFSARGVPTRGLRAEDDSIHTTMVRSFGPRDDALAAPPAMGEDLLTLLLECADAVHAAATEAQLAEALVDAASRGTGLANAAVLRPLDADGHLQILASRRTGDDTPAGFSRSLLNTAATGVVAELSGDSRLDISQSMISLGISAAVCAPLMLGGTVAAFLYLDNRGATTRMSGPRAGAAAFCQALSRMAGLALANLKRIEIEKRQAALEHDLSAAARAQKWILPPRVTTCGPFTCTGESRAGAYLGGDFFDVLPLPGGRVAVALGDVSGHGVAASVLMTAAQGFLHAALKQNATSESQSVAAAVTDLNRFICPRRPANCFMTLWVGLFDAAAGTVTYVNAGHGYALVQRPTSGDVTMLDGGDDFPIGFDEAHAYGSTVAPLPPGGRALVISDGLVEQFDNGQTGGREQFGIDRVRAVLTADPTVGAVAALFDGVVAHAGCDSLQDDATAVLVTW